MRKGERLTDRQVREIRNYYRKFRKHGTSYRKTAFWWEVSHMTIARIVRGETYKGVK